MKISLWPLKTLSVKSTLLTYLALCVCPLLSNCVYGYGFTLSSSYPRPMSMDLRPAVHCYFESQSNGTQLNRYQVFFPYIPGMYIYEIGRGKVIRRGR